jgi:hypothetical protein
LSIFGNSTANTEQISMRSFDCAIETVILDPRVGSRVAHEHALLEPLRGRTWFRELPKFGRSGRIEEVSGGAETLVRFARRSGA